MNLASAFLLAALTLPALVASTCAGNGGGEPNVPAAVDAGGPPGSWLTADHSKEQDGCRQRWTCDCSSMNKPGCTVKPTAASATTVGVCTSDDGPPETCTRCMALEPHEACACVTTCP